MTSSARILELQEYRKRFESDNVTEGQRIEILKEVQVWATEEQGKPVCIHCKTVMIYIPYNYALIPGHVYSSAGIKEINITGYCEYCFDDLFKEDEDD